MDFTCNVDESLDEVTQKNMTKSVLIKLYKQLALDKLTQETEKIVKQYNFDMNKLIVKDYKTRYGQCRSKDIYLNYRIIMLPIEIIRHIIIHELCHIKLKNHSKKFWDEVYLLDDNAAENRKWISKN